MGIVVEHNEITFWEPSQTVGKLFFNTIFMVAKNLKIDPGIEEYLDDTFNIDYAKFKIFVSSFNNHYIKSNNQIEKELLKGSLIVSLAIYSFLSEENELEILDVDVNTVKNISRQFKRQ